MLFTAQWEIGWDQLYYGQISIQWAHQVTANSNYTLSSNQFYAMATSLVWQYILECWQQCNQALHNPQEVTPEAQVLAKQVHQILQTARGHPKLEDILPTQPIKSILQ